MDEPRLCLVDTPVLTISYRSYGPDEGLPIVLMHGFPYSAHAYDEAAHILGAQGFRA